MAECKSGGKRLMVWTVNHPDHMMEVRFCPGYFSPNHMHIGDTGGTVGSKCDNHRRDEDLA